MSFEHAAESDRSDIETLIYKNTPLNGLKTPFFFGPPWREMGDLCE